MVKWQQPKRKSLRLLPTQSFEEIWGKSIFLMHFQMGWTELKYCKQDKTLTLSGVPADIIKPED